MGEGADERSTEVAHVREASCSKDGKDGGDGGDEVWRGWQMGCHCPCV